MSKLLIIVLFLIIIFILIMELIYRIKKYRQNKIVIDKWNEPVFYDIKPVPSIDIKYILEDKCINEVEEERENKRV